MQPPPLRSAPIRSAVCLQYQGASEEIQVAKEALYAAMTQPPGELAAVLAQCKPAGSGAAADDVAAAAATAAGAGASGSTAADGSAAADAADSNGVHNAPPAQPPSQLQPQQQPPTSAFAASAQQLLQPTGSGPAPALSANLSAVAKRMPPDPLALLHRLVDMMRGLVDDLRERCLQEGGGGGAGHVGTVGSKSYSSLSQAPEEWAEEPERPCGGERPLLMFDRWRKLLKSFYNEKKKGTTGAFDISKIPDIYGTYVRPTRTRRHRHSETGWAQRSACTSGAADVHT